MRVPPAWRWIAAAIVALVLFAGANIVYQVARKPTEVFLPLGQALNKAPDETWRAYGPLFRDYATASVPAELLAALAQMEGAGNPVAHTYWRWSASFHPFEIFRPASSAVGMYQMTDGAFTDARRFCIRRHVVVDAKTDSSCNADDPYLRVLPAHAVELTAISLDRQMAAILKSHPTVKATPRQRQDLAALIHLCGAGPARLYVRHGFRLVPGARCGDHDPAEYLRTVAAYAERFRRLRDG